MHCMKSDVMTFNYYSKNTEKKELTDDVSP